MKIITLGALVVILIAINFLFRRGIDHIKKRNIILDYTKRYLPVMELIGWSIFTIWLIDILFSSTTFDHYLKIGILVLVLALAGWFLLRDFIAGVQVKSRFNLVKGQKLFYHQINGEIKKLGLLAMSIKEDKGSDLIIPYAKIDQKEIRLNFREEGESEASFTIELNNKLNEEETVEKLFMIINNSAWASYKSKPEVQVIGETKNTKQYEITFKPNVTDGAKKLKTLIMKAMTK